MKKGWKIFAIVCGSLAGIGLILCLVSLALGFSWEKFVEENPYGIGIVKKELAANVLDEWDERNHDEEEFFHDDESSHDILSGSFEKTFQDVQSISVRLSAGEMEMKSYDGDTVKIVGENVSEKMKVCCYMDGNTLEFKTSSKIWKNEHIKDNDIGRFTLYLPESVKLNEADIEIGAGELLVEGMDVAELDLNVGVGEAVLKDIYADESGIHCGVGSISVEGELIGDIEVKCGVGDITLTLYGAKEDFNYEIAGGVGNLKIGGQDYKDVRGEVFENNGAPSTVEIAGGIGEITIDFR